MDDDRGQGGYSTTSRSRARRRPQRASYDRAAVHASLDAGLVAHVAWVADGQPFATPTAYWREGDAILWHGSAASRMLEHVVGAPVCITVTSLDGLVLGRSGFAHSINYTSVMAYGTPELVDGEAAKRTAMEAFIDRVHPGRSATLRPMTSAELAQITVVRMEIEEASLKRREGPPAALDADEGWPVWSGVVPVAVLLGAAEPAPFSAKAPSGPAPAHLPAGGALGEALATAAGLKAGAGAST